jgi:hypothetical protein
MSQLSPELVEKLTGYLTNRRDKRIISFTILALYVAAVLYHFVGGFFGAPVQKEALDSVETIAMVVVVAHIAGGVAQRAIATRAKGARRSPEGGMS